MKNQYALFNNENQIYVSATDAANFEKSNNLYEFLDEYGLFDQGRDEFNKLMDEYNKELDEYNKDKAIYDKALAEYNKQLNDYTAQWDKYNAEYAQYLQDLRDYQNSQNQVDLYAEFTKIVGTSSAPLSCYDKALNGDSGCYLHVLAHLVDYTGGSSSSTATYTTSSGDTFSFGGSFISGSFIESNGLSASFVPLSKELSTSGQKCDGEDDLDAGGTSRQCGLASIRYQQRTC